MTDFLNTKDAAEYLNIKRNTLEVWRIKAGGPDFCKFGRTVRYRKQDLDKFIEQSLVKSTSQRAQNPRPQVQG